MSKKHWIKGAIKHPAALKRAAKAAGESTMQFARAHQHDTGTTGQRARLALTMQGFHHKKQTQHPEHMNHKIAHLQHKANLE